MSHTVSMIRRVSFPRSLQTAATRYGALPIILLFRSCSKCRRCSKRFRKQLKFTRGIPQHQLWHQPLPNSRNNDRNLDKAWLSLRNRATVNIFEICKTSPWVLCLLGRSRPPITPVFSVLGSSLYMHVFHVVALYPVQHSFSHTLLSPPFCLPKLYIEHSLPSKHDPTNFSVFVE